MEVSFPNDEHGWPRVSGHHTPETLARDLKKLERSRKDLPTLLYHIKPSFQARSSASAPALKGVNLDGLRLGDQFIL